jgi:hypothetical protein
MTRSSGSWVGSTKQVLTCAFVLAASAQTTQAGINVWTSHGPEGGITNVLAVDHVTPGTLYAGTDTGVFKNPGGGGTWAAVNMGCPTLMSSRSLSIPARRVGSTTGRPVAWCLPSQSPGHMAVNNAPNGCQGISTYVCRRARRRWRMSFFGVFKPTIKKVRSQGGVYETGCPGPTIACLCNLPTSVDRGVLRHETLRH